MVTSTKIVQMIIMLDFSVWLGFFIRLFLVRYQYVMNVTSNDDFSHIIFFLGITKECCILILISIMVMVLKKHFIPQIVS